MNNDNRYREYIKESIRGSISNGSLTASWVSTANCGSLSQSKIGFLNPSAVKAAKER